MSNSENSGAGGVAAAPVKHDDVVSLVSKYVNTIEHRGLIEVRDGLAYIRDQVTGHIDAIDRELGAQDEAKRKEAEAAQSPQAQAASADASADAKTTSSAVGTGAEAATSGGASSDAAVKGGDNGIV